MRLLKRALIFVHRWLGVALCLLFLLWFPSGIVMMYWRFPEVSARDRLDHAPALDRVDDQADAGEAFAKLDADPPPTDGAARHVRRASGLSNSAMAATRSRCSPTPAKSRRRSRRRLMLRAASRWSGQPASDGARRSDHGGRSVDDLQLPQRRSRSRSIRGPTASRSTSARTPATSCSATTTRVADVGLPRRHPALAVFHAAAEARSRMEPRRSSGRPALERSSAMLGLVIARLDVVAVEALPL